IALKRFQSQYVGSRTNYLIFDIALGHSFRNCSLPEFSKHESNGFLALLISILSTIYNFTFSTCTGRLTQAVQFLVRQPVRRRDMWSALSVSLFIIWPILFLYTQLLSFSRNPLLSHYFLCRRYIYNFMSYNLNIIRVYSSWLLL
ncbi:hypothetical protein L9F63_013433, partial [Diploptera punctata]